MSRLASFTLASALLSLLGCAGSPPPLSAPLQSGAIERCKVSSESEIAALFERWNRALKTGEPAQVLANYAPDSVLLPTLSKLPRLTPEAKVDYFEHFLHDRPSGKIDSRSIQLGRRKRAPRARNRLSGGNSIVVSRTTSMRVPPAPNAITGPNKGSR